MSVIEVNQITKSYGDVLALNNVSFTVEPGTVYGFIGPNGAGKTTTIRILLGILRADSGTVFIDRKDAWSDAVEIHKNIAYVPGEVSLWPNLTGGEVIDFFSKLKGERDQQKLEELYTKFDLDPSKKCRTYSKGNRQKVALIAALASTADIYIFDEPTSGLDPLMEQVFQEYVLELKKQNKTVFLSSHILSEVEKLCDIISIIREGEIVETGTLQDLRYLTRTKITIEAKQPITDLDQIEGVFDVSTNQSKTTFYLDSSKFSEIIKHISKFDILNLESVPPTLEDLFMRHYEK
jgi:ABC-2 type transport system ATP-binding protein